jgi:hypothetical protein
MKMTVEKQLYVCVQDEPNALAILDGIELCVNANMIGDRQIMVSAESLEAGIEAGVFNGGIYPELVPLATEILAEAQKQDCGDINIYC